MVSEAVGGDALVNLRQFDQRLLADVKPCYREFGVLADFQIQALQVQDIGGRRETEVQIHQTGQALRLAVELPAFGLALYGMVEASSSHEATDTAATGDKGLVDLDSIVDGHRSGLVPERGHACQIPAKRRRQQRGIVTVCMERAPERVMGFAFDHSFRASFGVMKPPGSLTAGRMGVF